MYKARWNEVLGDRSVVCRLCPHACHIQPGQRGACKVRRNLDGVLYSESFDRVSSMAVDPVEKKPLFHVRPGSRCFSLATAGCNLRCSFCQNWRLSQCLRLDETGRLSPPGQSIPPHELVAMARSEGCRTMAFTYSEPTVFFELCLETAKLAREADILPALVTNGYTSPGAIDDIAPHIAAANVDIKSSSDEWYRAVTGGRLPPVLDAVRRYKDRGVFVEITTLLIPGENDDEDELRALARFIASVDPLMPWHLSAFHPDFHMRNRPRTPEEVIDRAYGIAKEEGLGYVYPGNQPGDPRERTCCHACGEALIERQGYRVGAVRLRGDACPRCEAKIPFVA